MAALLQQCSSWHVRPCAGPRSPRVPFPVPPTGHGAPVCRRHCPRAPTLVVSVSTKSIDPLANRTKFEPGFTMPCHSEGEINKFINDGSGRLIIVMCKSSHCKPCKAFMSTYHLYAERFADSVFLEVVGDENVELRKLMKAWEVKVTPTFRVYRNGKIVEIITGTGGSKLLKCVMANLKENERGRDFVEATHEELVQDDA